MLAFTDRCLLQKKFGWCGVSGKEVSTDIESTEQQKLPEPHSHTNLSMRLAHQNTNLTTLILPCLLIKLRPQKVVRLWPEWPDGQCHPWLKIELG